MSPDTATVQAPNAALDFGEAPEFIIAKPAELAVQCVVFVGDYLTANQKKSPNFRLGGKLYPIPDFYTVPNGIVQRCKITRLQDWFRGYQKHNVPKEQWGLWNESYVLKNQWNPATGRFEDIEIGTSGPSVDLLYKAVKPIHEIGRILQDGVVALDADCGINSGSDIKEAQFHYFPDWLEIAAGEKFLPERLRDMEDHLRNRREQTRSAHMRAIGDAYLESCDKYRDMAKANRIDVQSAAIKETEKFTGGGRYDEVSERLFRELELTREDKLHESTAKAQNDAAAGQAQVAEAIALLAKLVAGQQTAAVTLPPAEQQAPAPETVKAAAEEFERSVEAAAVEAVPAVEPETIAKTEADFNQSVEPSTPVDVVAAAEPPSMFVKPEDAEPDAGFTDMSSAIIEPDVDADAVAAKYLAEEGVETDKGGE